MLLAGSTLERLNFTHASVTVDAMAAYQSAELRIFAPVKAARGPARRAPGMLS
jgi:hypothetical protein